MQITTKQAMRYARQISLLGFDLDKQEKLLSSRVIVIGAGGLGCPACLYLVASGIGHITIVDDDVVELTNLQRQILHTEQDVGKSKVDSAKETLSHINSDTSISIINKRLDEDSLTQQIGQHDIVLDCSDNLETRSLVNKVSFTCGKPMVSGAAIRMEGQLFVTQPSKNSACYACISHFFGEQELSCADAGVLSPVVGIIGTMQALQAIKVLCDFGTVDVNELHLFDAVLCEWRKLKVSKERIAKFARNK